MRCYERKEKIWISDQDENSGADIRVRDLPIQILIDRDVILIKGNVAENVYLNDTPVSENQLSIEEGDTLTFYQNAITFFAEHLEIEGNEERIQTTLLPCKEKAAYFEGFPFYKRSP